MVPKRDRRQAYALRESMMAMRPPRILLAEDDADIRRVIATALRLEGYSVIEVGDGAELLEHVASALLFGNVRGELDPIALVISDIRMPGRSGLDVLAALREADVSAAVILVTAYGGADTIERARRLGADALVHKPFEVDMLCALVRDFAPHVLEQNPPASWRAR